MEKDTIKKLKVFQSSLIVFSQKLYNFHWNMKGELFLPAHAQTEKLFETITKYYDQIAELVVQKGDVAIGTLKEALGNSIISEDVTKKHNICEVNSTIVADLKELIKYALEIDACRIVNNIMDDICVDLLKHQWMTQAQLDKVECSKKCTSK